MSRKAGELAKGINVLFLCIVGVFVLLGSGFTLLFLGKPLFQIAMLGYGIALVFGFLAFRRSSLLWVSVAGWAVFGAALFLDAKQARDQNQQLCLQLRADPACVEDVCGFQCSGRLLASVPGTVCKDKDMDSCEKKWKAKEENGRKAKSALAVYSDIVDKIIASPSPDQENFEDQLVAVYNCLGRNNTSAMSEIRAVDVLIKKNLSQAQMEKYTRYLASKGRHANPGRIVAGLPAGNSGLSCETIGVN